MIKGQTWTFMALAAGLFLYILAFERDRRVEEPAAIPALLQLDIDQVRAVELRRGAQRIRLEMEEGQWMITKPLRYPALRTRVVGLLEEAKRLSPSSHIPEPADKGELEQYGLNPPGMKLRFEGRSTNQELHLGSLTLGGENAYLRVPGRVGVFVVPGYVRDDLTLVADRWRDPRVVHLGPERRRRVNHIIAGKGDQVYFSLEFNATSQAWRLTQPAPPKRADADRVRRFLDTVQGWRVTRYLPASAAANLQSMGLLGSPLRLQFNDGTNRLAAVDLGGVYTNNLVYARDLVFDTLMTVPGTNTVDRLTGLPWAMFGDHRLVDMVDPNHVGRIEIRAGAENTAVLARESNSTGWRIQSPIAMRADPLLVAELLNGLLGMEAAGLAHDNAENLAEYQLNEPVASFTLLRRKAPGAVTNVLMARLDLGKNTAPDATFARRLDEPRMVYTTSNAWRGKLRTRFFQLRDRQLFDFTLEDITKVTLQAGEASSEFARNAQQIWNGPEGPMNAAGNAAMGVALKALGQLRVVDWVERGSDKADEATYGFMKTDRKITLHFRGDDKPRILIFGKPNPDGHRFTMGQVPPDTEFVIFQFPKNTYALLAKVLDLPK